MNRLKIIPPVLIMSKTLLLATRNRHKQQELQAMLAAEKVKIITLDDVPPIEPVEEDGLTFAANAEKKARLTALAAGYPCLADDSGLVVAALQGRPGVYSARFAGPQASDADNNQKLLTLLRDQQGDRRQAEFVCVIAISDPQGNVHTVKGTCSGHIAFEPVGSNGFGYDPLFIPDGYDCTFAQLREKEKNTISHRAKALEKARSLLERLKIID